MTRAKKISFSVIIVACIMFAGEQEGLGVGLYLLSYTTLKSLKTPYGFT